MDLSPNWYGTGLIRDCSLYYWKLEIVSNVGEIRKLIRRGYPHSRFESGWVHQTQNKIIGTLTQLTEPRLLSAKIPV